MKSKFFSALNGQLEVLCSVGIVVAAIGCTSESSEVNELDNLRTVMQAEEMSSSPMVACESRAQCTMPLISGRESNTVALRSDGIVWTWGNNDYGQLGDMTTVQKTSPVQVKVTSTTELSNVVAVAAGTYHTVALRSDGIVWTWGKNDGGQLGNGNTTNSDTPVNVTGLSNIVTVAAGDLYTIALKSNNTIWT